MKLRLKRREIQLPPVIPIVAVLVAVTVAYMATRVGNVTASEVGILINNLTGNVSVRMEPGSFFYNSITTDAYTIDKTVNTLRMRSDSDEDVRIKTSDGSDVRLDVEVNYSLLLDEKTIRERVIPETGITPVATSARARQRGERPFLEAYQAKWVRDYCRSIVRYVFGTLTTEEFYNASMRDEKALESERELNRLLNEHGILVLKVIPDKFRFYDEYERKIREKKEADQEVEKQKELAKAAIEDQKRKEVEATKSAEVEVERIKGQLERIRIEALGKAITVRKQAEAYAYTTKVEGDAALYGAERTAQATIAAAQAEAESLANLVKALEGDGGRVLVMRALASALASARVDGVPYATSPVIQKLQIDGSQAPSLGVPVDASAATPPAAKPGGGR